MTLPPAVKLIWDIGIAVGPVLGYFYQYYLIRRNNSVGTFSINLCGALLFCNILRLGFWFFSHYDKALVAQSILMIVAQLFLLHVCVKAMNSQGIFQRQQQERDRDENGLFGRFWRWPQFYKYTTTTSVFAFVVIVMSVELSNKGYNTIGDVIGYVSLISESLIMTPQIYQNFRQKRVKGLSHLLVFLNITGDLMKLAYFFLNGQPMQFKVCGFIQVFLDLVVILQILYYGKKNQDLPSQKSSNQSQNQGQKKVSTAGTDQKAESAEQRKKPTLQYNQLQQDNLQ